VEIMVAMVIGMLGIIIMMQMFALFEGQKRSTTGGGDALNAGSIATYGIHQNLQQAGYCFSATAPTLGAIGTLRPVMIDVAPLANNGIRDVNTNTLLVSYGNDACAAESASGVASAATLNVLAYAVRNGDLWQCNYLANDCAVAANWVQIASDIVSMKAECVSNQGVRIVLVARNNQLEKTNVTAAAPTWSGVSAIDLTATGVDAGFTWQNYRYKTFETLAPIRNTIWTGGQGC
jgi:type IV pilus assembly protein PilW